MYNLTSINAVQFQNLLNAIGQSGGADISEQLEAINTTLQNLQIQFSALASNVSLDPIEGLSAANVQTGISELNSSLNNKPNVTTNTFSVNVIAGVNIITNDNIYSGTFPVSMATRCFYTIYNHSIDRNTQTTLEVDGDDTIIINSTKAQRVAVRWFRFS